MAASRTEFSRVRSHGWAMQRIVVGSEGDGTCMFCMRGRKRGGGGGRRRGVGEGREGGGLVGRRALGKRRAIPKQPGVRVPAWALARSHARAALTIRRLP